MKMAIALLSLGFTLSTSIHAQVAVDTRPGVSRTWQFQTHAANNDPSAVTPAQIAAVNKTLAEKGNTEAAFQLAIAYMTGDGITQNLKEAERWFKIGATRPQDKAVLAALYESGDFFPRNLDTAAYWYTAAGRPEDLFGLARSYRSSTPPQTTKAIALYRSLLKMEGHVQVRQAQMELGNLVLDGQYSAGDDAASHALNLEWARIITQELLGQQEYTIAVAYDAQVEGVPKDKAMWLRFCRRAAAYNIDLGQEFYGKAILQREISGLSPLEGYAWIRLSTDKRYANRPVVAQLEAAMQPAQKVQADSIFDGLVQTRTLDGAYYPASDPLREPTAAALRAMADDDPDVQLRRAFELEKDSQPESYEQAIKLYRIARDRREMDVKVVLGRDHMYGTHGVPKDAWLAQHWLLHAANAGSRPAALYLGKWYSGDGSTADPAQAYAWTWLGTESGTKPSDSNLSPAQKQAAEAQIAAWRAKYPGW